MTASTTTVQFDLGLSLELAAGETAPVRVMQGLVADQVHVLAASEALTLTANGLEAELMQARAVDDGLTLLRFDLGEAAEVETLELAAESDIIVRALTLFDSRADIFTMLPLGAWGRSSVERYHMYRTTDAFPPAFSVRDAQITSDDWNGSEDALRIMPIQPSIQRASCFARRTENTGDVCGVGCDGDRRLADGHAHRVRGRGDGHRPP